MNKLEYLKIFFNQEHYVDKPVVQSILSIQLDDESSAGAFKSVTNAVYVEEGKFKIKLGDNVETIEGDTNKPLVTMNDKFDFPSDFHPVLKGKGLTSTFGLMLFNIVVFYEPLLGLPDYVNQTFTKSLVEGMLKKYMVDETDDIPEGKVGVNNCLKLTSAANYLEGLGQFYIKPGGIDTLTPSDEVIKRRDELFELHKDELDDPVVFTELVDELVELDRQIQLKGPSKDFYINDGFISNARKRMFIAFGVEPNSTFDGWVSMTKSLEEGTEEEKLVHYINTSVAGTYGRAMATGEGGSRVKDITRLISRYFIVDDVDDCGSPVGEDVYITKDTAKTWVGSSYIRGKGLVKIAGDNVKGLIGTKVKIRVPQFCIIENGNYCKTCLGESLGGSGKMFVSEVTTIPTNFMLNSMSSMHVTSANTIKLDLNTAIKN